MPGELYTYAKAAEEQPVQVNGKNDYKIEKGFAMIERIEERHQVNPSTHVRKGQPLPQSCRS